VSEAPLVVGDLLNLVDGSLCGAGQAVAFGLPASVVREIWRREAPAKTAMCGRWRCRRGIAGRRHPVQWTSVNVGSDPYRPHRLESIWLAGRRNVRCWCRIVAEPL